VADHANVGHSCSGRGSSRHITRVAYGSANADTNSHRPVSAKPSISSVARSRNDGAIAEISLRENGRVTSLRRRA